MVNAFRCKTSRIPARSAAGKSPSYLSRVLDAVDDVLGAVLVAGAPVQVQLAQAVGAAQRAPPQHCVGDTASAPDTATATATTPRGRAGLPSCSQPAARRPHRSPLYVAAAKLCYRELCLMGKLEGAVS